MAGGRLPHTPGLASCWATVGRLLHLSGLGFLLRRRAAAQGQLWRVRHGCHASRPAGPPSCGDFRDPAGL